MTLERAGSSRRRKPVRLPGYDYSQPGAYFVTICAEHRRSLFGDVIDGEMNVNSIGEMVREDWDNLQQVFAGIILDARIIMPDHLHGVIMLGTDPDVSTMPKLGDVVRYFKGRSTSHYIANIEGRGWPVLADRLWQHRYFDRIVQSDKELDAIRDYIETNPYRLEQRRKGEQ